MKEFNLKLADESHEEILLEFCKRFFEDSHYSSTDTFDEETVRNTIRFYWSLPKERGLIILLTYKDTPVGFIAGLAFPSFFSKSFTCVEQLWWVDKDYRGLHSLDLLKALEAWARHVGCSKLLITKQIGMSDLDTLMKRYKFSKKEQTYFKELN